MVGAGAFWAGTRVYGQAMDARGHLLAAMPHVEEFRDAFLAGETEAAESAALAFEAEAEDAAHSTSGRLWSALESLPIPAMENLRAVRVVAEAAQELGSEVLVPSSAVGLATLTPVDGRVDLAQLAELGAVVSGAEEAVSGLEEQMSGIDRSALLPQVSEGVTQLADTVTGMAPMLSTAADTIEVLPGLLGADGPRNYLLMFVGNAELRAGGGGPGSFVQVRAEAGAISIVRQAAATEFEIALPESVVPLEPETEALYSDVLGRWIANLTGTADFPTSAALARGWWSQKFDDQIDGVMSIDPVALSYLLPATGPIPLPTGETLTADNAVSLLLNEVYFAYPTGPESNAFFDGAAAAIFTAVLGGGAKPVPFVEGLVRGADEGRIKFWSAHEQELSGIGTSEFSGILPGSNQDETAVGVYFNDTTGAKMDYYTDATIDLGTDQCTAAGSPTWTATVAFSNTITRDQAAGLPGYITGPYYTPGDIATDVIVYTPVGAQIQSWTVDGVEVSGVHTTHLGRDAVRLSIVSEPASTRTVVVTMRGEEGVSGSAYGPLQVRHTPMVRETPVTLDAPGCR